MGRASGRDLGVRTRQPAAAAPGPGSGPGHLSPATPARLEQTGRRNCSGTGIGPGLAAPAAAAGLATDVALAEGQQAVRRSSNR